MITNHITEIGTKLLLIYVAILNVFYKITQNTPRLIALIIIFIFSCYTFNVPYYYAIVYLIISSGSAFSEHLVSNMENTWAYKKPEIGIVPIWLIPLWANAIIIIIELYKLISVVHMPI